MMRYTTQILPSRSGNLGVLLINNPRPLHALTLDMMHCMQDVLKQWYADESLAAILIKSDISQTKTRAFCAGGDVKAVYMSGINDDVVHGQGTPGVGTAEFFRQEYIVNHMIATGNNKPFISLWDGLVMGGGVGISIHGKYRVATENTTFAMPETKIGLFPDVGSMYWMPRLLQPSVAVFLALTGHRLDASDLIYTGLATHYIPSDKLEGLERTLVLASVKLKPTEKSKDLVAPVLMSFHEQPKVDPSQSFLAREKTAIDTVFNILNDTSKGVQDIMTALQQLDSSFGDKFYDILSQMSPTSMKVTLEGLRRGSKAANITQDLQMEYRMSQACMRRENKDFYEGIRAALVDKDNKPQWQPSNINDVTDDLVASYFDPIEHEWEIPKDFIIQSKSKL